MTNEIEAKITSGRYAREIEAKITSGCYAGDPIKVQFGRPLKIWCRGKDVSDVVMELRIDISIRGQILYLKFAEIDPTILGRSNP